MPVHEAFRGETVWQGDVEIFDLHGHPKAKRAYAWSHLDGDKDERTRFVAVLEIPPVVSAETAVRVQIVKDARMKKCIIFWVIMLAIRLTASDVLTISPLGNGFYQIVAPGSSGSPIFPRLPCVLQSSSDLISWSSISTNAFPYTGDGYGVTNIVQGAAPCMFFRVISPGPISVSP